MKEGDMVVAVVQNPNINLLTNNIIIFMCSSSLFLFINQVISFTLISPNNFGKANNVQFVHNGGSKKLFWWIH